MCWPRGITTINPSTEHIELEKLRQLEALKWVLEDLADELREIRMQRHRRRVGNV
ncbi:MAG: hypothetical protein KAY24_19290 [Candidatus Eisenbacteria sp.]|nr:hypothetical protein [Candidatus Eisenbacteria bacterium]